MSIRYLHFILWSFSMSLTGVYSLSGQQLSAVKTVNLNFHLLELVPLGNQGFVLFEYQARNLNDDKIGLILSCYDHLLNKTWESLLPISKGLQLKKYEVSNGNFVMVFAESKQQYFEVFTISAKQGAFKKSYYRFSNPLEIGTVLTDDSRVWVAGRMFGQGVLFELSEQNNSYRILPTAYANPVTAVVEIEYDQTNKILSYLLQTSLENRQTYILRQLDASKKVLSDLTLKVPAPYQLDQVKLIPRGEEHFIAGTFFKKNVGQTSGIFYGAINQGIVESSSFMAFKEIEGFDEYTSLSLEGNQPQTSRRKQFLAIIDHVVEQNGRLLVSLELMEEQYQPKGALQQEFERSQLINILDQDQTGRRSFDQASSYTGAVQSAEDRIYRGSATDILNYRYSNAIVGQPMFFGYSYNRSVLIQFGADHTLLSCKSVRPPNRQVHFMGTANTINNSMEIWQAYDKGGEVYSWDYGVDNQEFSNFKETKYLDGSGKLFHLFDQNYIAAEVLKQRDQIILNLQRITF